MTNDSDVKYIIRRISDQRYFYKQRVGIHKDPSFDSRFYQSRLPFLTSDIAVRKITHSYKLYANYFVRPPFYKIEDIFNHEIISVKRSSLKEFAMIESVPIYFFADRINYWLINQWY